MLVVRCNGWAVRSVVVEFPEVRLRMENKNFRLSQWWRVRLPPMYRLLAMVFVVATLAIGVVLSVQTHFVRRYDGVLDLGTTNVESGALAAGLAYPVVYWISWLARKCERRTRILIGSVALVGLGLLAIGQGPKQLNLIGFAARNRTPDPAAVAIANGGGLLALWQIANFFWTPQVLSTRFVITLLIFVNVYLVFAAW